MPARCQSGITTSLPSMRPPVPGALAHSDGISAYLPPVRVPELAWRAGDADEQLTAQDREWWAIHGWKSQRGVRTYQSVRAVEHVLINMLETTVTDFFPPEGLSRMSIGDTLIWDEQEGRWYRGAPPLPGLRQRTSMEPELPNIGRVQEFTRIYKNL